MRRLTFVLVAALSSVALFASAASGLCIVQRFEKVLAASDAAWWVTVTDAALSGEQEPGYWRLTVRVEHALKGPPDGTSATVYGYSCGGFMTERAKSKTAEAFVGTKRFFMGDIRADGSMVTYSEFVKPQGLTPSEQYQRALDDLGLEAPSPSVQAEPRTESTENGGGTGLVWVVAVAAIVALGALGLFLIGRRRSKST
jgi:hypothetical protein